MPISASWWITPMCAQPRAAPEPRTSATLGLDLAFEGFFGRGRLAMAISSLQRTTRAFSHSVTTGTVRVLSGRRGAAPGPVRSDPVQSPAGGRIGTSNSVIAGPMPSSQVSGGTVAT